MLAAKGNKIIHLLLTYIETQSWMKCKWCFYSYWSCDLWLCTFAFGGLSAYVQKFDKSYHLYLYSCSLDIRGWKPQRLNLKKSFKQKNKRVFRYFVDMHLGLVMFENPYEIQNTVTLRIVSTNYYSAWQIIISWNIPYNSISYPNILYIINILYFNIWNVLYNIHNKFGNPPTQS